jgi:NAD(P)-dependent dehydrogenase (short-subunit alcohol dehydrogenase family)
VAQRAGHPIVLDLARPRVDHPYQLVDLADTDAAAAVVTEIAEQGLDAVVTCAAIDSCGPLGEVKKEDWERVINVNLLGTAAVIRAALPALIRSRGQVVTIASTLGRRALPDATAYCASKFGVVGFTRALNAEMGDRVRVTCVMPGGMNTAFFDDRPEQYRPGPDADLMDPADIAAVIVDVLARRSTATVPEVMITPAGETSWP